RESLAVPETAPAEILIINLTSECAGGDCGQVLYNSSSPVDNKLTCDAKTNDTTPTLSFSTNKTATCAGGQYGFDLNYTDWTTYDENSNSSTTGDTNHVWTLVTANATNRTGPHLFSLGCRASDNENRTSTSGKFLVNITTPIPIPFDLFLNGLNQSRKYELGTKANISAQCDDSEDPCQVEIDLFAPGYGYNFSSGASITSFTFNITTLRIINFSNGNSSITISSSDTLNVTIDNKTEILSVSLNVTSTDVTDNLNITVYSNVSFTKTFRGSLRTQYLEYNQFIYENSYVDAINLTFTSGGSDFILSNLTDLINTNNITFDLSGFDLDANNEFHYTEHFNGTSGSKGFNETLSFQADAPLGIF
ncbi:hypothetical protein LCGC14_3010780, partial [marine sediment metagenome]